MDGRDQAAELTHVDRRGRATMVDIAGKEPSLRQARAYARVTCSDRARQLLGAGQLGKGDAFAVSRIAGIAAAKRTPDLIPLCHPIALSRVSVDLELGPSGVEIQTMVCTRDRTGVEMEALTAASVAALTLIDMIKAVDRSACIESVQVIAKSGGRSGDWLRPHANAPLARVPDGLLEDAPEPHGVNPADSQGQLPLVQPPRAEWIPARPAGAISHASVITISDRCAAELTEDRSGPVLVAALAELGIPATAVIVADSIDQIQSAIRTAIDSGDRIVLTTGGTGVCARDVTPQATEPLLTVRLTGLESALRRHGEQYTKLAALSRGVAGLIEDRIVVNLPGSTAAARQSAEYLVGLLPHLLDQLAGGDHARTVEP